MKRQFLLLGFGLTLSACSSTAAPSLDTALGQLTPIQAPKIQKSVLLVVPAGFADYTYSSSDSYGNDTYRLGRSAVPLLQRALSGAFDSVTVRNVTGDAGTMLALSDAASRSGYDYVAVPSFADTKRSLGVTSDAVETTIRIEFVSADHSHTIATSGHGKGEQGSVSTHGELAHASGVAIGQAAKKLVDDILSKRAEF